MTDKNITLADRRAERGYSLSDVSERDEWRGMLTIIEKWLDEEQLHEEFLFHGTSTTALDSIDIEGMRPDFRSDAIIDPTTGEFCTFWGNLDTACFYAEDTVAERHPGSKPVILAISVDTLETLAFLQPDGASIDFPIDGLTRALKQEELEMWQDQKFDRPWRDGLNDFGAIIAVHDEPIDLGYMRPMRTKIDAEEFKIDQTRTKSLAI